jgi:hypothetical protein
VPKEYEQRLEGLAANLKWATGKLY